MRGIGCLMMVIVPVFSYAVGNLLAGQGFGSQILPESWYGFMTIPPALAQLTGVSAIFGLLGSIPHLPATLTIAGLVIIVVGGIISIIYGYLYTIFAPSKYGATDVPPPRVKTKKYKR